MQKSTATITIQPSVIVFSVFIVSVLIGGSMLLLQKAPNQEQIDNKNNVSMIGNKQVIQIHAKGGYQPRVTTAKAGIPTVLKFDTNGTFDCSSSVRIPSLNISKILPPTGSTEIELGIKQIGRLQGSCGMGMYPFEIDFQS